MSTPSLAVCLEDGKVFRDTFRGNFVEARHNWNKKCKMCARWHIKHVCFKNCRHKESHVPESKVPDDKKTEMKTYVDKVRAQA